QEQHRCWYKPGQSLVWPLPLPRQRRFPKSSHCSHRPPCQGSEYHPSLQLFQTQVQFACCHLQQKYQKISSPTCLPKKCRRPCGLPWTTDPTYRTTTRCGKSSRYICHSVQECCNGDS